MEATIIAAIVAGLIQIANGLLNEAVPSLLVEPVRQPLERLVKRKGHKAGEDKALLDAFRAAITAAGCPSDDKDATAEWLMQVGLNRLTANSKASRPLRRIFAYAVLAQTSKETPPPEDLIRELKWPRSRTAELSVLLAELRRQLYLLDDGDWRRLIEYEDLQAMLSILSRIDRLIVLTPQGEAFVNVFVHQQSLTKDEAAQIEISYKNDLVNDLSRHRLPGSDGGPVDLPLLDIFMDVGVRRVKRPPQPENMRSEKSSADVRMPPQESDSGRVTEALGRDPRLVLLGPPGAGKSIVIDYVALMFAKGLGNCGFGIEAPYVPVIARLENFAVDLKKTATLTLDRYLVDSIREAHLRSDKLPEFITTGLEKKACIVLLDGLDEVGDMRPAVIDKVAEFAGRWSKGMYDCNRLVVTSRIEGYWDAPLSPLSFAHMELGPLQPPEEVREFLLRWFMALEKAGDEQTSGALAAQRAEQRVAALLPKLMASASVQRLSTNPLLLTLLAMVFEKTSLPGRRVEVFLHCTDALLRTVRKSAHNLLPELLDSMSMEQIWDVLAALAYWTHARRSPGEYTSAGWRQRVESLLRAERGSDHYRASRETSAAGGNSVHQLADKYMIFLKRDAGLVAASRPPQLGFFHQTFQEYLAGRHIATRSTSEWRNHFREHWADPYWSEALLLAMGHVGVVDERREDLGDMLVYLLNIDQDYVENKRPADQNIAGRQVLLAGRAVADIGVDRVPPATLRWVLTMLQDALRDWNTDLRKPFDPARLLPLTRFDIGRILDEIGWLPDDLNAWVLCRGCTGRGDRDPRDLMVMKYPVTNAQYARFVAARSYEARQWWGGEAGDGWRWRMRPPASRGSDPVCEPAFWRDYYLGQGRRGYPVVGVSWHEANAYAAWLTAILHRARRADADLYPEDRALVEHLLDKRVVQLRLPEEVEWAKAAGSITKYDERFPWGAQSVKPGYDFTRASMRSNTADSNLGGTSPVAMYPLGASQPFGLMDVGGNVYEWTASWYGRQRKDYAARGGSWRSWIRSALCSNRIPCNPGASRDDLGFRLVAVIEA